MASVSTAPDTLGHSLWNGLQSGPKSGQVGRSLGARARAAAFVIVTAAAETEAAAAKQHSHEYTLAEDVSVQQRERKKEKKRSGWLERLQWKGSSSSRQPSFLSALHKQSTRRKLLLLLLLRLLEALQHQLQQLTFCWRSEGVSQKGDRRRLQVCTAIHAGLESAKQELNRTLQRGKEGGGEEDCEKSKYVGRRLQWTDEQIHRSLCGHYT